MHRVGLLKRAISLLMVTCLFLTATWASDPVIMPAQTSDAEIPQGATVVLQVTSSITRLQFPAQFNPMELCCRDFTGDDMDDDVYGATVALSASLGNDLGAELDLALETGSIAPLIDWITAPMDATAGSVTMRVYPGSWSGSASYIERTAGLGQYSVDADNPLTPTDFTGNVTDTGLLTLMGASMDLPIVLGPQGPANTTLTDVEMTGQLTFEADACLGICSEDATGGDPSPQGGLEVSGALSLDAYFTTLDTAYRQCSCAGIDPGQPVLSFGENIGMGSYDVACTANTGTPGNCTDGCANLDALCPSINLTPTFADLDLNSNSINDAFSVGMRFSLAGASAAACVGAACPTGLDIIFEDGFEDGAGGNNNQPPVVNNQMFALDENSPNGTPVGTIVASDPDSMPPDNTLSWALIGGQGAEAFAIDSANGNLSVAGRNADRLRSHARVHTHCAGGRWRYTAAQRHGLDNHQPEQPARGRGGCR